MTEDQKAVLATYPQAGAIMLNRGLYYIVAVKGNKMSGGVHLSGLHKREIEAWKDAASKLVKEGNDD